MDTIKSTFLEVSMSEPTSSHPQVATWLAHIRALAVDIGPRGSTREGERKGAEYAQAQFEKFGLKPVWESFKSARSIFQPHLVGSLLMLLAFAIFPLGGKTFAIIAALLSILVLVSELQELGFQDNFYRRILPKGDSQNVHAIVQPASEYRQDLILVGHLDSQRTPLIFRTPAWVKTYDRFTTILFVTFILQVVLYTLAIFIPWNWVWYATIPTAICAVLLAALCIQADSTPFTAGANDNATAAGLVLALANHFGKNPLQHTRVFAVCTGCEEVQHYGMIDWYKRHRSELKDPRALVFEMLGCAGPAWLTREGIIVPFKADAEMVALIERLARDHPEWGAYETKISGGNTEMADAVRAKVPAVTFFGMTREGVAPYWHQTGDTFDKMNPVVMEKTWVLVNAFIQELDK
jgi:Peptidase family M28